MFLSSSSSLPFLSASHWLPGLDDQSCFEVPISLTALTDTTRQADPTMPNWQQAFWGSNYNQLKQIRKKWDPNGVLYAVSTPGTESWEVIQDGTKLCKRL